MQFEIAFVEGEVEHVRLTVSGDLTVEGNQAWLAELVGDPRWRPGMKVLLDGTALHPADFAGRELQAVVDPVVSGDAPWGAGFCAAFVEEPTIYGLIRMWQAATSKMQWQTEAFYTRDEAVAWLETASRT